MDPVPFHIGITTDDLDRSMRELSAALGVSWTPPTAGEGAFTGPDGHSHRRPMSCISLEGPIHIDLIQGWPDTLWAASAPAIHHFAYWTDDLAADVRRLTQDGWKLELTKPDAADQPALFAYLVRADGVRIELIDNTGRSDYFVRLREQAAAVTAKKGG
jgi:hypothetical protein